MAGERFGPVELRYDAGADPDDPARTPADGPRLDEVCGRAVDVHLEMLSDSSASLVLSWGTGADRGRVMVWLVAEGGKLEARAVETPKTGEG